MSRPSRKAVKEIAEELKAAKDALERHPSVPPDGRVVASIEHVVTAVRKLTESLWAETSGDGHVKR